MKTSALVLVYNKKPCDSVTLNSIKNSSIDLNKLDIVVWNNGPNNWGSNDYNWLKSSFPKATFTETLDNKPLSLIYNKFINDFPSDKYIFLDDDSCLSNKYLEDVLVYNQNGIAIPEILFNGKIEGPLVNSIVNQGPYQNNDFVNAIGSGLLISENIVMKMKLEYEDVFDTNFALYGVDTSFYMRISQINLSDCITCINGFEHSLSRLECESQNKKFFRNKERSISDAVLARRYKQFFPKFKFFRAIVAQIIGYRSGLVIPQYIISYFKGTHPKTINSSILSDLKYNNL